MATSPEKETIKAVLYSDGSAKPTSAGVIGWSVHGYTLFSKEQNKGAGHPKVTPTWTGYVEKDKKLPCAEINNYYNYLGWSPVVATNNVAELLGCTQALRYASTIPSLKELVIYSDSKYVVNGVNDHIHKWVANNWIKADGEEVKNKEEWKELLKTMALVAANDTKVDISWVKGHATDFGNIQADQLASIASEIALTATEAGAKETTKPAQGYWKSDIERNAMLGLNGWIFTVSKELAIPGEYCLTNQTKVAEFIGSASVNACFAYVRLQTPDDLLELVRSRQLQVAREFNTIAIAHVNRVYDKGVCAALDAHGDVVLRRKNNRTNNLHFINEDIMVKPNEEDSGADKSIPITEELYPPRLALRVITIVSNLKQLVEDIECNANVLQNNTAGCHVFEITDHFFDTVTKKNTTVKMFKKDISVGVQSVFSKQMIDGIEESFQLVFGIHTIARNNLKRLEETDVQVWLVVQRESPEALRYHTVIRSNKDWAAYSGVWGNLIIQIPKAS